MVTYRRRADFASADDYAVYVRENILVGMKVRCCQTYEEVSEGDTGTIVKVRVEVSASVIVIIHYEQSFVQLGRLMVV